MNTLLYNTYRKKLQGCFVGKAIGGTLGMPMEGFVGTKEVTYYDPVPTTMLENDDLDLQVVWLEVIRRRGLPINRRDLAQGWLDHMRAFPDEYGVVTKNLQAGLYPPLSGFFDNKFYAGMGASIRTEIWAALAPGDPALAVKLAREDACADHYADGVEASGFLAAVESAAFVESDTRRLIETGLSFLSKDGRLYRAFTDTIRWWDEYRDPKAVREKILRTYYRQNWTDVGINLSFILLAWLAGEGDFSKSICTAAGLGHDTDCTTATLGAILGIIQSGGFEARWTEPIGEALKLSSCISSMHEVSTIGDLCGQIAEVCQDVLDFYSSETRLIDAPQEKSFSCMRWAESDRFVSLTGGYDVRESLIATEPLIIKALYPEKIALAPGETGEFRLRLSHPNNEAGRLSVQLCPSDGWSVSPCRLELELLPDREIEAVVTVTAPAGRERRVAVSNLDLRCRLNGLSFTVTAGLVQTMDFLRTAAAYDADDCPPPELFAQAETVSAYGHIQPVPDGSWLYACEVRPAEYHPHAVLTVQGTRRVKVWLDGRLVLRHDGCEYVPAFHRSDYVAQLRDFNEVWHRLIIWVGKDAQDGQFRR